MPDGITQGPTQATAPSCQNVPFLTRENLDDLILIVLAEKQPAHTLLGNKACCDLYDKLDAIRSTMIDPLYEHDCDNCKFLGRYRQNSQGAPYDLYFCPTADSTVIARYGDDGPDYVSGMIAARAGAHPALVRALELAKVNGYLEGFHERA